MNSANVYSLRPSTLSGILLLTCLAACTGSNSQTTSGSGSSPFDRRFQGGQTTVFDRTAGAFTNPAPNMNEADIALHDIGDEQFELVFFADDPFAPGLGPIFNNNACAACHIENGRGAASVGTGLLGSQALVRISDPLGTPDFPGGPGAVAGLGTQLQDHAIFGEIPEADLTLTWTELPGQYPDGTPYSLRSPNLVITPTGAPLPVGVEVSLRVAPPVFGLGLLEAIPENLILSLEDESDSDGDGISGRANQVWDVESGTVMLGRFGRKANTPTLLQQTAAAYAEDMGVSNDLFTLGDPLVDIGADIVEAAAFYTHTLAVPQAILVNDPQVIWGEQLFKQANCTGCHTQMLVTGFSPISNSLSNQVIFPYTDMLLHDMGPGLADGRADFLATGEEWRTPPLWGIGIVQTVLGQQANFLHDGRARTPEEAILWHAGEAEASAEAFRNFTASEREALLAFLRSL